MKLTCEIPEALAEQVNALAEREGTTLAALVEEGLQRVLCARGTGFRLRDASVGGNGLNPELEASDWSSVRAAAYEKS